MKIQVELKNVYGNDLIYPVCEKAKQFCALMGKKTLSESDLSGIRKLGFGTEQVMGSKIKSDAAL